MSTNTAAISIRGVTKQFGSMVAVDNLSLDVREAEFLTLLGPSGCGKTTTMRMIAGFEEPDQGRILLRGDDVVGKPPNERHVNMCFQNYALFPHMSVEQNIEYGLRLKRVDKATRQSKVAEMLSLVRLEGAQHRKPGQLSGGQQQRVALARALVNEPAALLLDEPLGALDVKLRRQMQMELKRIQHELGTTFVYVTHDQEEALAMSDRIAVMNGGLIEHLGTPREVYERPATPFVADFVGTLNVLRLRPSTLEGDRVVFRLAGGDRIVAGTDGHQITTNSGVMVAVRPERVALHHGVSDQAADCVVTGRVRDVVYLGSITTFQVEALDGIHLTVHELSNPRHDLVRAGNAVTLTWRAEDSSVLRVDSTI
jgi:spermidine/putrescine transport system ATP-binding protein